MSALKAGIPFSKATINASSELNGKIVAAKKALKKRASSVMQYSQLLKQLKRLLLQQMSKQYEE